MRSRRQDKRAQVLAPDLLEYYGDGPCPETPGAWVAQVVLSGKGPGWQHERFGQVVAAIGRYRIVRFLVDVRVPRNYWQREPDLEQPTVPVLSAYRGALDYYEVHQDRLCPLIRAPDLPLLTGGTPTTLYRHFDASGRLLYVGISCSVMHRTGQHQRNAHWFNQIARIELEHFPSRDAALSAEAEAIRRERPLHNVVHNRAA